MITSAKLWKIMGCAFGASVAASSTVLLVGICIHGSQLAAWTEWQGRIVGLVATIAGVGGALIGLHWTLHEDPPEK